MVELLFQRYIREKTGARCILLSGFRVSSSDLPLYQAPVPSNKGNSLIRIKTLVLRLTVDCHRTCSTFERVSACLHTRFRADLGGNDSPKAQSLIEAHRPVVAVCVWAIVLV